MERVSLTALYAKGAVALRHNRIKNTGGIDLVSTSYLISAYYNRSRLNFCSKSLRRGPFLHRFLSFPSAIAFFNDI